MRARTHTSNGTCVIELEFEVEDIFDELRALPEQKNPDISFENFADSENLFHVYMMENVPEKLGEDKLSIICKGLSWQGTLAALASEGLELNGSISIEAPHFKPEILASSGSGPINPDSVVLTATVKCHYKDNPHRPFDL